MIGLEVVNRSRVERSLQGIAVRAAAPGPGLAPAMELLQHEEESIFAGLGGKYVNTGRLEASLTGAGEGAIRRLTPHGLEFGTDVPYAGYQGTTGPGNHQPPSAIMRMSGEAKATVPEMVGRYIMHGRGLL